MARLRTLARADAGLGVLLRQVGRPGRPRPVCTGGGDGRELAWFPAPARSRARLVHSASFTEWFYA